MAAPQISPEQIQALATQCWRSPSEFGRVFLPHWFPRKMPWVHRGIAALMTGQTDFLLDFGKEAWRDEPDAEWTMRDLEKILTNFIEEGTSKPIFTLHVPEGEAPYISIDCKANVGVIMPRGFSKTTLVNMVNLRDALYQHVTFFLYVSESSGHAERQLGTIKFELEDNDGMPENELINLVFGNHKPPRNHPNKWTENYIESLKGVMVGAVGRGGQIRGFGKRAKRPAKIVYDDLEDAESVTVDTQRTKDAKWFFGTAMPTVAKGGRSFIIGTLLHTDAILNKVIKSDRFTTVRFGAIDRQGDALWDFMMDLEAIEALKVSMAGEGELASFYLEYMSVYKDDEARVFPEGKLVYVNKGKDVFVAMGLAHDPAISQDKKSAMASSAIVGIEAGGMKHVLDWRGKVGQDVDEQIEQLFEMHFTYMAHLPLENRKYGIEAIGFQRAMISLMRGEMFKRSKTHGMAAYFEIEPIFHGKIAKDTRIKGILKPLLHSGYLTFNERWPALHSQLIDYPNGLKDGPDVVAMAVKLIDPFAALNLGEEGMKDLEEDSLPPLELVLGGRFQSAP